MAKLVFGMNQSLDGYVDHMKWSCEPALSATVSLRSARYTVSGFL